MPDQAPGPTPLGELAANVRAIEAMIEQAREYQRLVSDVAFSIRIARQLDALQALQRDLIATIVAAQEADSH